MKRSAQLRARCWVLDELDRTARWAVVDGAMQDGRPSNRMNVARSVPARRRLRWSIQAAGLSKRSLTVKLRRRGAR
jgi:hypothetical protein